MPDTTPDDMPEAMDARDANYNYKHNNRSGSQSQAVPMPANYEGGSDDFTIVRTLDAHWPTSDAISPENTNAHSPDYSD